MSEKLNWLGAVKLNRRHESTLPRWFHAFNCYRWPPDYPEELHVDPMEESRLFWRMCGERANRIQMELGLRVLKANNFGKEEPSHA